MSTATRIRAGDLLREALGRVLPWEGPGRVLTLTVDAHEAAHPASPVLRAIARELSELERRETARPDAARIVGDLRGDVEALLAHSGPGGFAVVADLEGGEVVRIPVDRPLPTRLRVGPRADLRPLVRSLLDARPAGVVRATAEGVEVGECRPPGIHGIVTFRLPELEEPDLRGPAHAHPRGVGEGAPGTRSSRQIDLFRQRIDVARRALGEQAAERVASEARERGWDVIVVSGEDVTAHAFGDALSDELRRLVVAASLPDWRRPAELSAAAHEAVAAARRQRASALLAETRATALSGGHAVLGVEATLEALAAERVRVLLMPAEEPIPGSVAPDGSMTALARGGPTNHVADEQLADAMIRVALAQRADVELVDELGRGEAAALLRW